MSYGEKLLINITKRSIALIFAPLFFMFAMKKSWVNAGPTACGSGLTFMIDRGMIAFKSASVVTGTSIRSFLKSY